MAEQSAARFQALAWQPGNPLFPTLADLQDPTAGWTGHDFGRVADFTPKAKAVHVPGHSAGAAAGFAGWYLGELWHTPTPIDFGAISDEKDVTVTVHNTNRDAVDLSSIDFAGVTGITLESPALPATIEAFSSRILTFRATQAGPASFDDGFVFTYSVESVEVRSFGRRVLFFAAIPQGGVTEQLIFRTDIMQAKGGPEQAFALRLAPRARVRIRVRIDDDEQRTQLETMLFGGAAALAVGVQSWWEARELDAAAADSDTVIQVDTTNTSLAAGDTVSFVLPDSTSVEAEVEEFTASSITLTQPVGVALPEGTHAVPVRFGRVTRWPELGVYPVAAEDFAAEFETDDERYLGEVDPAYFDAHPVDALPIIRENLLRSVPGRAQIIRLPEEIDGETGVQFVADAKPFAEYRSSVFLALEDVAAIFAWRKFAHFLHGSWGRFYLATFQNDLPLAAPFPLGGNTFDVPNMGLSRFLGANAPKRDLRIVLDDGTTLYRRITGIVDNGATEQVTVSSVVGSSGTSSIAGTTISWLHLCRIHGDVVTFDHHYSGRADVRFNVRTVQQ